MSTQPVFPTASVGATILTCQTTVRTTWVAIKLVDENDKPIPHAKYIIILPDGTRKEGNLDDNGYAYFDNLQPGNCTVGFPELDPFHGFESSLQTNRRLEEMRTGVLGPLGTGPYAQPKPPESIGIILRDEDDHGIPDEEFQIGLPNGDVARGFLNADGYAHVDGIEPGGECKVRFPKLDKAFVAFTGIE